MPAIFPPLTTQRLLSDLLHELLIQDIDIQSSEINDLLNVVAQNIILTNLSLQKRLYFYELIGNGDDAGVTNLIQDEIPDFNLLVLTMIKEKLEDIL